MKVKVNWTKIRKEYITVGKRISYQQLTEKYNVTLMALAEQAKKNGWVKARKEKQNKTIIKVQELSAKKEAIDIINMRIEERKDAAKIQKAIMNLLMTGNKINSKLQTHEINNLANAMKKVQDIRYRSFGIAEKFEANIQKTETRKIIFEYKKDEVKEIAEIMVAHNITDAGYVNIPKVQ